jgi:hypothetical protein
MISKLKYEVIDYGDDEKIIFSSDDIKIIRKKLNEPSIIKIHGRLMVRNNLTWNIDTAGRIASGIGN